MIFKKKLSGKQTFKLIWFGESISLLGTAMTRFALLIWLYQQTANATSLAMLGFFSIFPLVLFSPLAGIIIDRFARKKIMIWADIAAALMTLTLLILHLSGNLLIIHLYLLQFAAGIFQAFQLPAYSASITLLLSKKEYSRANGLRSFSDSLAKVAAPLLAGFMLVVLGINGIMLIDILSCVVAVFALLIANIPDPDFSGNKKTDHNIFSEWLTGFSYICKRPGLAKLLILMLAINLFSALTYFSILPAMILARSAGDKLLLASVESALGLGGLAGSLLISIWGGPQKQIYSILFGAAASFLMGDLLFAIGGSRFSWLLAAFLSSFFIPFIIAAEYSIWQAKVAPSLQGRIFSIKAMLQQITMPLGYLLAGPLADHFFEPLMTGDGILARIFGSLLGTGKGSGMALMFLFTGIIGILISAGAYFVQDIRNLEDEIADYEETTAY